MMKSLRYLCTLLLLTILGVGGGNSVFADTYEKYTGEITEGEYLICYNVYAMKAEVSSNRLVGVEGYSTSNSSFGDSGGAVIIWKIQKDGDYYTLYNENAKKYAASTGTKNQAKLEENVSDNSRWTVSGTGTYEFVNKANARKKINANLRNNGSYGFACYAIGTGGALTLYKKVESGSALTPAGLAFVEDSYTATLGESFTAPTLTYAEGFNGTVTYASSNTEVATVNANTGAVTLVAAGTTTITASFAGNDTYAAGEASYTLTVSKAPLVVNPKNVNSNYFVKVTKVSDLEDGDAILIVNEDAKKAMSTTQNTNNRAASDVAIGSDAIDAPADGVQRLILVKEGDDNYYFYTGKMGYLYAASSSNNYLKTQTDVDDNSKAVIVINDGNATVTFQGSNTRNLLKYNSSNTLFSCYASGQQDVQIYKEVVKPVVAITAPTFSVEGGTYFGAQSVELSCETGGATIKYSIDGETWNDYISAITISETTTLYAKAVKDENESAVVSATYTIPVTYTTIATFKEANTSACLNLTGAQVVYVDANKKNIYVRDNSGAICLYQSTGFSAEPELKEGDIMSGTIYGKYTLYNNLPEIIDIQNYNKLTVTANNVVTPKVVASADEISANMCDLVKITKTQISETDSKYYVLGVQLYDKLQLGYNPVTGVYADITGIVTDYKSTTEIFPRTDNDIVYYPAVPTFSPASGAVEQGTPVTITVEEGATIKYTVNGEEKTSESNSVEVPVTVDTEITAVAVKNGLESDPVTASYSIPRVASIGDVEYFTFAEALGDASEDDIITLLADVAEPYTLTAGQTLKLNLNGHAITINAPEGYELKTTLADGITTYTAIIPVAKIGETSFASLAEAVAAVPADGAETTITMIADETIVGNAGVTIPAGKNVVLNLNGKTISQTGPMSGTSYLVKNNGTLTIMDSSDTNKDGTGTGKMICTAEDPDTGDIPSYATNLISNYGVLNIESGYYQTLTNAGYASYVVDNYTGGTANISGGKLCNIAPNAYVVRMFLNSTSTDNVLNISGTTVIEGSYAVWMQYANANANKGTLNISGGTISATNGRAVYAGSAGGTKRDASNINVSISGGIINGTGAWFGADTPFNSIIVTGGEFADFGVSAAGGSKFVTGGTYRSIDLFTQTRTEDTPILADGYVAVKQGDVYVVIPESTLPAAPIIFHDGGEYEGTLTVAMAGEGTIMYTLNDGEAQTYSAPFTITEDATIKAWAVKDGVASDVTEPKTFTIKEKAKSAKVDDGYYTIQNNEGKYVNVAGRKTVTLVSDTKSAGTVIRVKADEDGVKVLRSQAVDLPRYAERAMSYVPEIVKEVVKKLAANVNDPIIGEQGADLILDKFNKEFDYHLYLEGENNTYRIYGRTPSMKPVVDFYAENKELVDSRLTKVEDFVKEVLQKIVDKVHRGQSVVDMFKVKTVWKNMGGTLTDPDVDQAKFFEEVLTSEENVWSFAYQTGMLYWDKVESYLNDSISELGDYGKYIKKIPRIRPNFKYYIVPSASGVDIISEGNSEIKNASTAWKLAKRDGFDVTFDATLSKNNGKEMYKTLYVDFAYELPENVKALKVESVSDAGVAVTKEITGVVPAQTPVLLMSTDVENLTKTLALSTEVGTAVTDNQLVGADYLINKYEINTPQVESIFTLLANLSQSLADEYSYLKRRNAGTVNNKYFFGLTADDLNLCTYKNEKNEDDCVVRSLSMGDEKLGFYNNWEAKANEAFLVSEKFNPVKLTLVGDVNRDGKISIADVNALVEIVLGTVTEENNPNNYDFEAAHVNADEVITIADVTALVNMIIK